MAEEKRERVRLSDAVTRMIELTQQGRLEWRAAISSEMPEDEDRVTAVYITEFNGRKLRLYGDRIEVSRNESLSSAIQALAGMPAPTEEWRTIAVLEFINDEGISLWRFPFSGAISDLLDAVQYRVAGVNEFLAEIEALAG
jgi:hypothetical protein